MLSSNKTELEHQLTRLSNKRHCLLVSRGATALYLSYLVIKKLSRKKGSSPARRIVLPAILCHSPANVALYAGLEIVFCDVDINDYTLDPKCLRKILQSTPDILAVVSVSIFGHTPDLSKISSVCQEFDTWLIDDAAQSIGGFCLDQPLGGWGDIGIYSFGHTKIIDVGWGGAIMTDNSSIYEECVNLYNELPRSNAELIELRTVYSEAYYSVERLTNKSPLLNPLFWDFPTIFRSLYIYKEDGSDEKLQEIDDKLETLNENLEKRHLYWNEYRRELTGNEAMEFPLIRPGSAPWRFTFRVKNDKRNKIVTELRARRIDVSTWYPSLFNRFSPIQSLHNGRILPVSEMLTTELVNLWLDPEKVNKETIATTCDVINTIVKE